MDRQTQTGDLISLTFLFKESEANNDSHRSSAILLDTSKELVLEVNAEKSICSCLVTRTLDRVVI
jgi:hypothetical protein